MRLAPIHLQYMYKLTLTPSPFLGTEAGAGGGGGLVPLTQISRISGENMGALSSHQLQLHYLQYLCVCMLLFVADKTIILQLVGQAWGGAIQAGGLWGGGGVLKSAE
jgi:hypothetical protein